MRCGSALIVLLVALGAACDDGDGSPTSTASPGGEGTAERGETSVAVTERPADALVTGLADVVAVSVSGEPGGYRFEVTVHSPDSGCERYADWWEVLTAEGALLYRRVLLHSHVDEQPFTRSGGPIPAAPGQELLVRAHMNQGGFGGVALRGTPAEGFVPVELPEGFAAAVESLPPLPEDCAF